MKYTIYVLLMILPIVSLASGCQNVTESDQITVDASDFLSLHPVISTMEKQNLSDQEIEDLVYMREEEKLARDVYTSLYNKWGQQIFSNIAQSEQTHTDSVRYIIERYGLEDPVKDETIGVFTNQDLQNLYNDLVKKGSVSLQDALIVGATIEDLDIFDLNSAIARTDNQDIIEVYNNLTRGSRNHLRAFTKQLEKNGGSYEAQYLSSDEINKILQSDSESGRMGAGMGRGSGNGKN
ncbi:DUF2202 domain-containing protein [Patescibacteria group bacterium]|nr:DUF2202 domain-containing protein [Patescibacteria group bacterium]